MTRYTRLINIQNTTVSTYKHIYKINTQNPIILIYEQKNNPKMNKNISISQWHQNN